MRFGPRFFTQIGRTCSGKSVIRFGLIDLKSTQEKFPSFSFAFRFFQSVFTPVESPRALQVFIMT